MKAKAIPVPKVLLNLWLVNVDYPLCTSVKSRIGCYKKKAVSLAAGGNLEAVLLGGGREEAPHAVRLQIRGLLNLGQGCSLGAFNQGQNLRALALSARRARPAA